ncbi:MAG: GH3 auxin-responsive promoter family protein [Nitrospirota bacterium]
MFRSLYDPVLSLSLMLTKYRDWNPFIAQTHCPERAQQAVLRDILRHQAGTAFGRTHRFGMLRTYEEFAREVPICTYEDLRSAIEAQEKNRELLLTSSPPLLFTQTSGTTGVPKHIPILKATVRAIRRYQRLFAYAQWQGVPAIYQGSVLVINGQTIEGRLPGGTPFGSMSGLMFDCLPGAIRRKSLLRDGVPAGSDYRQRYRNMAVRALADPSLSVLATPNPSTILKLLAVIRSEYSTLLELLAGGSQSDVRSLSCPVSSVRLSQLQALVGQAAGLDCATLWPNLRAVVTWTGGNCAVLIAGLRALLPPRTRVIEMGYLSSECLGTVNVDVLNNRCVPTLEENFFEFVEVDDDAPGAEPVLLHHLQEGRNYAVIVTTRNGLYRYAMNDIIEVTGFFNRTPTIRFIQKGKGVTNITGEKLYEHQVTEAVGQVLNARGLSSEFFVMLADVEDSRYTLCLEHIALPVELEGLLEERLSAMNIEFKAKRASGRLQPIRVLQLRPGTGDAYRQHCVSKGQREAQFKLIRLQYAHECTFDFGQYGR